MESRAASEYIFQPERRSGTLFHIGLIIVLIAFATMGLYGASRACYRSCFPGIFTAQGERRPGQARSQAQSPGATRGQGQGDGQGELARLRAEFAREARSVPELMDPLEREQPGLSRDLATLEGSATSRSAPGTEAFKQDYARWETLKQGIVETLERLEASLVARLRAASAGERVATGPVDKVPEQYRRRVAGYFETIARVPPR